ncbi:MAG: methionine synthase [Chloroflexi bacterium]|nr:methionine synthase [Chloroflexota bacterium]
MLNVDFGCRATMIGSMPHKDPVEACAVVARYLKDFPAWPQLPNRSFLENMYAQFSQGFPDIVVEENRIYVDRAVDSTAALGALYVAYLENDIGKYPITPDYAAGLHSFSSLSGLGPRAAKGQVTGPVSWGLTVAYYTGSYPRPVLFDETLSDAAAKLLRLKAGWQERELRKISRNTIIFVDEPYMASFGSAFLAISREKVITLLNEVFAGISGVKGIHCCGNTDWPVLLGTNTDIINFDAYNHAQSLSLYPAEIMEFLGKKHGAIAWGIVPNEAVSLEKETVASLKDRLEEAIAPFTRIGIPFRQLLEQGLLTPSCGLAGLSEDGAVQALELLAGLSAAMRSRYL